MRTFDTPNQALFFKSPRANDERIGEMVRPVSEATLEKVKPGYVLTGYPDDEGIRINHGRVGAREAPDAIRAAFYKLTPGRRDFPRVFDLGNSSAEGNLRERHERIAASITGILKLGHRVMAIGGGHDYAYADGHGFMNAQTKKAAKPLIINFDAHLDVRPDSDGPNSGSAFYRILESHPAVELVEVGIQPHCNSLAHRRWAEDHKVKILDLKDTSGRLLEALSPWLKTRRPTFLSIDIDAFSSAFAPGASASYSTGLDANEFMPAFRALVEHLDIQMLGIYEVSPPLDPQGKTSQFAAIILHTYLNSVNGEKAKAKANVKLRK